MKKIIKCSFFCVGVIWAVWHLVVFLVSFRTLDVSDPYVKLYPSPMGGLTAALVNYSGGGALSPYCYESIVVFNSIVDIQTVIKDKRYEVYSAACSSFSNGDISPKITWVLDGKVRVEFALDGLDSGRRDVVMKGTDSTGGVHLEFYAHP